MIVADRGDQCAFFFWQVRRGLAAELLGECAKLCGEDEVTRASSRRISIGKVRLFIYTADGLFLKFVYPSVCVCV